MRCGIARNGNKQVRNRGAWKLHRAVYVFFKKKQNNCFLLAGWGSDRARAMARCGPSQQPGSAGSSGSTIFSGSSGLSIVLLLVWLIWLMWFFCFPLLTLSQSGRNMFAHMFAFQQQFWCFLKCVKHRHVYIWAWNCNLGEHCATHFVPEFIQCTFSGISWRRCLASVAWTPLTICVVSMKRNAIK